MNTTVSTTASTLALLFIAAVGACAPAATDDDGSGRRSRPSDEDVECSDDSDCRGGEVCDDDECVPACRVTDSCAAPTEGEGEGGLPTEGEGEGENGGADDVVIELSWPAATSDNDIDLHLSRTSPATWCSQTETCWWQKKNTSWGAVLEQDSIEGDEPEIIRLTNAGNGTYTVGVGVYSSQITALNATVRVLAGGVEVARRTRSLRFGVEWVPLSIRINGSSVTTTTIDTLREESGTCWSSSSNTTTPTNPTSPGTGRTGDACSSADDCVSGYNCDLGICSEFCTTTADCEQCAADSGSACTCLGLPGIAGSCIAG